MENFLKSLPEASRQLAFTRDFFLHVVSGDCMPGVEFCLKHHEPNCREYLTSNILGSPCRASRGLPSSAPCSATCCSWIEGGLCRAAEAGNFTMFHHLLQDCASSPTDLRLSTVNNGLSGLRQTPILTFDTLGRLC